MNTQPKSGLAPDTRSLEAFQAIPVQQVDVDGIPISYRRAGTGPPLLMIHGWPLNGATFREHVARLSDRWTCIVPDLPGSGGTPWDPRTRNMLEDWGHLLTGFVEALDLHGVSVIGHDSGGTMARVMAAELGDRVSALALGNTEISNQIAPILKALQFGARVPGGERVLRAALSSRTFRRSALGFGGTFEDLDLLDGVFHEAFIAALLKDARNACLALSHCDFGTVRRLPAIHARMTAPCLLIWGAHDPFFPLAQVRPMLEELPVGSRLEVIEEAKLFVHEEHPDRFSRLADAFFTEHLTHMHTSADSVRAEVSVG